MGLLAALLIGGGVSAIGSLGGAAMQSSAAQSASQTQAQLGEQSLQEILSLVNQGLGVQSADLSNAAGYIQPAMGSASSALSGYVGSGTDMFNQLLNRGASTANDWFNTAGNTLRPLIGEGQALTGSGMGPATSALQTLQQLLTPGANQTAELSQMPGFQFAQDWGQKGVTNQASTLGFGGNTLTAGANYATGLAQQNFGQLLGGLESTVAGGTGIAGLGTGLTGQAGTTLGGGALNLGGSLGGQYIGAGSNALGTYAGSGNILSSLFSGAEMGGLNLLGTAGNTALSALSGAASPAAGALTGIGSAMASGTLGSANAWSGGLGGATGGLSQALTINALLKGGGISSQVDNFNSNMAGMPWNTF